MCSCNKSKKPKGTPSSTLSSSGNFQQASVPIETGDKSQMVTVEYSGPVAETFTLTSRVSRDVKYRIGNNEHHRQRNVFLGDAEWMIGLVDHEGKPMYRILGSVSENQNDPAAFIGHPIVA